MSIKISYQNPGKRLSTVSDGQYEKRSLDLNQQQQQKTYKAFDMVSGNLNKSVEVKVGLQSGEHDKKLSELDLNSHNKCQTSAYTNQFQTSNNNNNSNNNDVILLDDSKRCATNKLTLDEFQEFLWKISPINPNDWTQARLHGKLILILRAPLLCLTLFTVPVVNSEIKNNNWNRLLNSIHCVTIPLAILHLLQLDSWSDDQQHHDDQQHGTLNIGGKIMDLNSPPSLPSSTPSASPLDYLTSLALVKFYIIIPCVALCLFVFYATNRHKAPKYHAAYSYFGFIMSVVWIYKLATEIISILKTVGIMFSMTDTAIGLGVLAWGNSLGDIVANLTLAEAGYARMALGASIGAPLLNLLLGFGLSFTISLKPGESQQIKYTHTTSLLAITLAIVLILLMLSTLAPGHKSKRPFGYLLISCYGVYFALAVCFECGLITF